MFVHTAFVDMLVPTVFLATVVLYHTFNQVSQWITFVFRPSETPDVNNFQVILVAEISDRGTTQPRLFCLIMAHFDLAHFLGHYIDLN